MVPRRSRWDNRELSDERFADADYFKNHVTDLVRQLSAEVEVSWGE